MMKTGCRIAHLTTVHSRYDVRILIKQCASLAAAGNEVYLIVADGLGDEDKHGVRIIDVGRASGRLKRMVTATRKAYRRALQLEADIYQFHDPELLPVGLALKRRGRAVVYDSHEDLAKDVLAKSYIRPGLRRWIAYLSNYFEEFVCRRLDAVIAATPAIRDKFRDLGVLTVDINNFPLLGELEVETSGSEKANEVCYVGGLASNRGIAEIVDAIGRSGSGTRLNLAGNFSEPSLKARLQALPGWSSVSELGFLDRAQVRLVLDRSVAGIVTLHPTDAYLESLPVKMFEYMSAGLPVIASDFPLWREIIDRNNCGICVDPLDPKEIATAIDYLVDNPEIARQMGTNGQRAVLERYNWGIEEKKLLDFYASILPSPRAQPTA
jgi:glycosyltransferase involved in cell wall biosynthesis